MKVTNPIDCHNREAVIIIASRYTDADLHYMTKNSNYNAQKVVDRVCNLYLRNDTLRNAFRNACKKYL